MTASNRKRPKDPAIFVPKPADDQPRFARIGAIAAIGFVIGVAWPGLARVQLVPQPPGDDVSAGPSPSNPVASAELAQPLSSAEPASPTPAIANPPKQVGPKVRLADIVSCVDADGKKRQKCDAPALDPILVEPLKSLLACDGAEGQSGLLSLGFDIDFSSGNLSHFTVGRSTTLDAALARSLSECAKAKLTHFDLAAIEHNYASYRAFYLIEFSRTSPDDRSVSVAEPTPAVPAASPSATPAASEIEGQSGRATVTWDVAIVRKAPKDGAIVARVLGGTRVTVTGRKGDWYRVKYNAKGDEGFVFKSAIGL